MNKMTDNASSETTSKKVSESHKPIHTALYNYLLKHEMYRCLNCFYFHKPEKTVLTEHCKEVIENEDECCGLETPITIFEINN